MKPIQPLSVILAFALTLAACLAPLDSAPPATDATETTGTATQADYSTARAGFSFDMNGGGTLANFNTLLAAAKAALPSGTIILGCNESAKQVGTSGNIPILMCSSLTDSTMGADFVWLTSDVTGLSVADINTAMAAWSVPSGYRQRTAPHMHIANNGNKLFLVGTADNSTL